MLDMPKYPYVSACNKKQKIGEKGPISGILVLKKQKNKISLYCLNT